MEEYTPLDQINTNLHFWKVVQSWSKVNFINPHDVIWCWQHITSTLSYRILLTGDPFTKWGILFCLHKVAWQSFRVLDWGSESRFNSGGVPGGVWGDCGVVLAGLFDGVRLAAVNGLILSKAGG